MSDKNKKLYLDGLPDDFLVVDTPTNNTDEQLAQALSGRMMLYDVRNPFGRLHLTVEKARLVKNYGMTRMDPYVRIQVGHTIYETNVANNQGKNPSWNRTIQCILPQGVTHISIEVYDECSFIPDELIAWTEIAIPPEVFSGQLHSAWHYLSGKQGERCEGQIKLTMSFTEEEQPNYVGHTSFVPHTGFRQMSPVPVFQPNPIIVAQSPYGAVPAVSIIRPFASTVAQEITKVEIEIIMEMFPTLESDLIKSVYEAHGKDKEETVNALLQICQ